MAENTNTKPSINAVLKESLGSLQSLAGPDAAGDKIDNLATIIDYKMVTFSLAGKDYAIDIMKVKEIAKAGRFTYVPNALPFFSESTIFVVKLFQLWICVCSSISKFQSVSMMR